MSNSNLYQKIETWKANLADLGRRNPLINFRLNSPRVLQIIKLGENTLTADILFEKLRDDVAIYFQPNLQNTSKLGTLQPEDEQLKRLKKLRLEAKKSFAERGVNSLFIALGTLTWHDKNKPDYTFTSPLILLPVELVKERGQDKYSLSLLDEDVVLNPTLVQKLQTFGIDLPELDEKPDYQKTIQAIHEQIESHKNRNPLEQDKWKIEEDIFLSLFSYAKAAMVRDLIDNESSILDNSILQALAGDLTAYQSDYKEPMPVHEMDVRIEPEKIFQILDADSSQQVVIEAAKSGSSFVVQGPPGTGKSQTIVNIIAELIGSGKSVLLVAEKETALSVVSKRFEECGLGDLCLNLHHNATTNKREFVQNLSLTVERLTQFMESDQEENYDQFFQKLKYARKYLSSYLTTLHQKNEPLNKSAFELFGDLLKMESKSIPNLRILLPEFKKWDQERLNKVKNLLDRLSRFSTSFFNGKVTTIWSKSSFSEYSFDIELEIKKTIEVLQGAIIEIENINKSLTSIVNVDSISNLEILHKNYSSLSYLLKAPNVLPNKWDKIDIRSAQNCLNQLKDKVQVIVSIEPNLKRKYSSGFFKLDLRELSKRYQGYGFFLFDMFNNYQNDRKLIKNVYLLDNNPSDDEIKKDLTNAVQLQSIKASLSSHDYSGKQMFGTLFNPNISKQTELQPIEEAIQWLIGLQKHSIPTEFVQKIVDSYDQRRKLQKVVDKLEICHKNIEKGLDFFLSHFSESDITNRYVERNQISFNELNDFIEVANSDLEQFQDWLTYKEITEAIDQLGAKRFLDCFLNQNLNTQQWFPSLEKAIYSTCCDSIRKSNSELKNFDAQVYQRQIEDFIELDSNQLNVARKRLKRIHANYWQTYKVSPTYSTQSQNLRREANKRRAHLPIRTLLSSRQKGIPNLVKALKPCWMMSPLSVSQYINPKVVHFDVLIFDEASQIRTEDVISSIIRADQVIVIGDRKQLPPTSFFVTGNNNLDGDDNSDDEVYESFLDECSNFMFGRQLKWHYRSRDERLITFSNHEFYDSQLVTFPNPIQDESSGVYFQHVPEGVYDIGITRKNQREAETVARLALEHFTKSPSQSLGIIAFSEAQAEAIQEQIEILGSTNSLFNAFCSEDCPDFFLKALENVQGDERDAILLSVGYGFDNKGKLSLNFGPISKQGGERRLNVAITRAKDKITVVSSIRANDINLASAKSEGARVLRNYLEYAANGGQLITERIYTDKLEFGSPFEEDVYNALIQNNDIRENYIIRTQVGCSGYRIDLAIAHKSCPNEFLLGIECDGASYHSSPTARDRDRLRQQVLERLGWKIHRIWSTEYFKNKPKQLSFLIEKIMETTKVNS